jgi:hypothetical protein
MIKFNYRAAQGEIQITKISSVPHGASPVKSTEKTVIGHSESGHVHYLEKPQMVFASKSAPEGMRILYAILTEPNALVHERGFDTHEPVALDPGVYEFRITREHDPYAEKARQQAD